MNEIEPASRQVQLIDFHTLLYKPSFPISHIGQLYLPAPQFYYFLSVYQNMRTPLTHCHVKAIATEKHYIAFRSQL